MAKITEVVSSISVKVNVGDYQSVDFFTSMKSQDEEGVKPSMTEAVQRMLNANMIANLKAHFAARGKKLSTADICKRFGLQAPTKDFP